MTAPVNYSTSVPVTRTVGEMQAMLGQRGAEGVGVLYTAGKPTGMTFVLRNSHFRLPVDVDAMERLLVAEDRAGNLRAGSKATRSSRAQAERVAWRVVKDWLAAQLSLVDASMVTLDEVMLPYLVVAPDTLLRDQWRNHQALTVGGQ